MVGAAPYADRMPTYPLARLQARSFGPIADVDIALSPGLNVIVGDNGTGKTQLLKLGYVCTSTLLAPVSGGEPFTKTQLDRTIAAKLLGVFRPTQLGRLTNRTRGRARSEIAAEFTGVREPLEFSFATNSATEVRVAAHPTNGLKDTPVFLPAHELLSIYPGLAALYASREVEFDETWRDTAELLARPALRGPRASAVRSLLGPIEEVLEGAVVEEGGRFFLRTPNIGKIEAPLIAEGQRKLAMIDRLVTSGVLLEGGYLFWDEPEANLNPRTQQSIARTITTLAQHGSQILIASHSLYLLRELQMATEQMDVRYIGLAKADGGVTAQCVTSLSELDVFTALDAESEQSIQYLMA